MPSPEPVEIVRLMQYNIILGGAVTPRCKNLRLLFDGWEGESTFEDALAIIKSADPDILVVNEACDWRLSHISEHVVESLGMNDFFVGEDFVGGYPDAAPDAIFTKYKIVEAESLRFGEPNTIDSVFRGIKATIITPSNVELIIFGVHLVHETGDVGNRVRYAQIDYLIEEIERHQNSFVILTGDMNETYHFTRKPLEEVGMIGLLEGGVNHRWTGENWSSIDQIWVTPNLKFHPWSQDIEYYDNLENTNKQWKAVSDHNPEAALIAIYPP